MKYYKIYINKFLYIKKKYIEDLIKLSLFTKKILVLNFNNLIFNYILNKKFKKNSFLTNILTFNYKNKSYIFINLTIILNIYKNSKIKLFLIFIFYFLHSILHSQKIRHNNIKNRLVMFAFQNNILLKYGFFKKAGYRI